MATIEDIEDEISYPVRSEDRMDDGINKTKVYYYDAERFRFVLYFYYDEPKILYLGNLDVWEQYQGQGIGTAILKFVDKEAIDKFDAERIRLICLKEKYVYKWYLNNGYKYLTKDKKPGYVWLEKRLDK